MKTEPLSRRSFLKAAALAAVLSDTLLQAAAEPSRWRMRLATSSVMFPALSIEEVCERVSGLALEALDIWAPFGSCRHLEDVDRRLGAAGLKQLLARHKLKLCSFSIYGTGLARYARLAREFGGSVAVRESQYGKVQPGQISSSLKVFFEKLKPEIELAAQCGVKLAIENHGDAVLDTLDSIKAFVDLNPAPDRVGIALAPYHLQVGKTPVDQAIKACGSQLLFFYAWQHADGFNQLPGHGSTDLLPWLRALAAIDYSGYVTPFMHGEPPADQMTPAVAKARDALSAAAAKL